MYQEPRTRSVFMTLASKVTPGPQRSDPASSTRFVELEPQQRQEYERAIAEAVVERRNHSHMVGKRLCLRRCQVPQDEWKNFRKSRMAANVVVILLQDRTANKIEIEPKRSKNSTSKFIKRRPQIPDTENCSKIVLTIPRRVYTELAKLASRMAHTGCISC